MKMNAVILAGGVVAPDDPLFPECRKGYRSLLDIHGKPMVQWVIDALSASASVEELYLVGLPSVNGLTATKPLHVLPDEGGMFENIRLGTLQSFEDHPALSKVLIASADIPAIRPDMVDWLADQVSNDPEQYLYYNVISKPVMEKRFPNASRSFVRFQNIAVCGGDLNVIDHRLFSVEQPIWTKLAAARKHPLKQASLLGIDSLLLVALRLVTLEGAVARVCKKLSLKGCALVCPYAEVAMDADKPHQLTILRHDLGDKL